MWRLSRLAQVPPSMWKAAFLAGLRKAFNPSRHLSAHAKRSTAQGLYALGPFNAFGARKTAHRHGRFRANPLEPAAEKG